MRNTTDLSTRMLDYQIFTLQKANANFNDHLGGHIESKKTTDVSPTSCNKARNLRDAEYRAILKEWFHFANSCISPRFEVTCQAASPWNFKVPGTYLSPMCEILQEIPSPTSWASKMKRIHCTWVYDPWNR